MNTKASSILGWVACTVGCCAGAVLGWRQYYYGPGGRQEREAVADVETARREERERAFEERVREERRLSKESDGRGGVEGARNGVVRESPAMPLDGNKKTDVC